ncbi:MAG: NUDIX hydrolase [Chitinophagales bacterium]|nr:NUDIX hydrolase [Chitinophagales bacterium]
MTNIIFGKVAAAAAILKDGKILLLKRSFKETNFPGYWTFPSGGIEEMDESHKKTVEREVLEETSLRFTPKEKFNFYESVVNNKRYFSLVHLGEWKGEVKINEDEASEFAFFSYEEARHLDLAFAYKEVIEDLHKTGLLN